MKKSGWLVKLFAIIGGMAVLDKITTKAYKDGYEKGRYHAGEQDGPKRGNE